jgi:flagellar basal-body rod protein FlgF
MSDGIYVALSGAIGRSRQLESVANNLANLETSGFRRMEPAFSEYLSRASTAQAGQAPDAILPAGREVPTDRALVVVGTAAESQRPGVLHETGAPLDLALDGEGYFVLQTPAGPRYTRDGHFRRGPGEVLTAEDGSPVLGQRGAPIQLPNGTITITPDGTVRHGDSAIDRLRLVRFQPEAALQREGGNRYQTAATSVPAEAAVRQGLLEASNVQPLNELVTMIEVQRSFEALQQAILSYREIDARANDVGKATG